MKFICEQLGLVGRNCSNFVRKVYFCDGSNYHESRQTNDDLWLINLFAATQIVQDCGDNVP